MTEREALLTAVCADPNADLPRLVYADWLDAHGDPARAEFIRVQCELARRVSDAPDRSRMAARAERLAGQHMERWQRELPRSRSEFGPVYRHFARGFPTTLYVCNSSQLTPALFAAAPVVRLNLIRANSVEALVETVPPERLRSVTIHVLDDATARQLLDWLTQPSLRFVRLQLQRLRPAVAAELQVRLTGRLHELPREEPHPNIR